MGLAYAAITLRNPSKPGVDLKVTALADSGATMLCIPETVAKDLQLEPNGQVREVTVADGRRIRAPYVGPVELWFEDRHCYVGALILGDEVLLGAIPMEDMDLRHHPLAAGCLS